jgi:hypothetical protein
VNQHRPAHHPLDAHYDSVVAEPNYDSIFNRVIGKVRTTQHQNPEFGHTQGEIKKNRQKKYISIQGGMKLRKLSILVVN